MTARPQAPCCRCSRSALVLIVGPVRAARAQALGAGLLARGAARRPDGRRALFAGRARASCSSSRPRACSTSRRARWCCSPRSRSRACRSACRCGSRSSLAVADHGRCSPSSSSALVLRPLVNQEAVALLMATLGVTYFLDGFGQTLWGSDIYAIELGIAREPVMVLENVFQGGILINRDDVAAAVVAVAAGRRARRSSSRRRPPAGRCAPWPTTTRRRSRSASRSTASGSSSGRSPGVVAIVAGVIWGGKLGVQFSHLPGRAEGAAGRDPRRLHLGARARSSAASSSAWARRWPRCSSGRRS